jgi:hypothetical protein
MGRTDTSEEEEKQQNDGMRGREPAVVAERFPVAVL